MEENSVEGSKTKIIIASIIIIIIVIASIGIYLMKDGASGITALEGLESAIQHSNNGTLIYVQPAYGQFYEGTANGWVYYFSYDNSNVSNREVSVYRNGTIAFKNSTISGNLTGEIESWVIDSDEAYEISLANSQIRDFKGDFADIILHNSDNGPLWAIRWSNYGLFDNPSWASIEIDATTGEILYVHVDN